MKTIIRKYKCVNKDQVKQSLAILEKEKYHQETIALVDRFKTLIIERNLTEAKAMLDEINARVLYEIL